jgi:hypothetical protein
MKLRELRLRRIENDDEISSLEINVAPNVITPRKKVKAVWSGITADREDFLSGILRAKKCCDSKHRSQSIAIRICMRETNDPRCSLKRRKHL